MEDWKSVCVHVYVHVCVCAHVHIHVCMLFGLCACIQAHACNTSFAMWAFFAISTRSPSSTPAITVSPLPGVDDRLHQQRIKNRPSMKNFIITVLM